MKKVIKYQSDNGQLYDSIAEATKADKEQAIYKNYEPIKMGGWSHSLDLREFLIWAKRNKTFLKELLTII